MGEAILSRVFKEQRDTNLEQKETEAERTTEEVLIVPVVVVLAKQEEDDEEVVESFPGCSRLVSSETEKRDKITCAVIVSFTSKKSRHSSESHFNAQTTIESGN